MKKLLTTSFLCLVLASVASAQTDAAALERLVLRFIGPWGDPNMIETRILTERLPEDLGLELPLPDDAVLLGSIVRRDRQGDFMNVQAALDTQLNTLEAVTFFLDSLREAGWEGQIEGQAQGFVPAQPNYGAFFCAPDEGPFLFLTTLAGEEGTDVRLELNFERQYTPCETPGALSHHMPQNSTPMPMLVAPEEATLQLQSNNMDNMQAVSSTLIFAEPDFAALYAHYLTQMTEAGWSEEEGLEEATFAVSHLRYSDEEGREWQAVLTLSELNPGYFYASVVVVAAPVG